MSFTEETIHYIAHLARLDVDHVMKDGSIQEDLNQIVIMLDQISITNTENIQPMAHPLDTAQRLRKDSITESNERDILLALAPLSEEGLFLVPSVIE